MGCLCGIPEMRAESLGAMKDKGIKYGAFLALLALWTSLVYANALGNPFHYDDFHSIVNNTHLRSLAAVPSFFIDPAAFSARPESAMYRPLLLSSFALNYAISAYATWSYHLVSLLLHLGCIVLLAAIARRLLGPTFGAWLAVALFAVHPINSECLNYISSRSEILAAFFFLLAFWLYLQEDLNATRRLFLVGLAYACALLSKSITIVFPAVILAFDMLDGRRLRHGIRAYAALGCIGLLYVFGIWRFLARAAVGEPVRTYSEQFWTQVKALVFYLKMLLWPSGQNIDHQFLISNTLFDPIAAAAFFFVLSLVFFCWYHRLRHPRLLLFLLWFLLVLAPSSVLPLNVLVNEHRLYLPGAAFFMAVGYAFDRLLPSVGRSRWIGVGVAVAVVVGLSAATIKRNEVWASPLSLWSSAAAAAPLMARPFIYLGEAYEQAGQKTDAVVAYEHALTRDPDFAPLHLRLGKVLLDLGARERALSILVRGTELEKDSGEMWSARAEAHRENAQWQESLAAYQQAIALSPDDSALHNNLGNTYQVLEQPQQALIHHLRALELNPADAPTLVNLGNAYTMLGRATDALAVYGRAVELAGEYAGAWLSFARALEEAGQITRALDAYGRAGQLNPSYREYAQVRIEQLRETARE